MSRIVLGGFVLLTLTACAKSNPHPKGEASAAPHPRLGVSTEEEWIVSEVARNIAVWGLGAPESSVSIAVKRATSPTLGPVYEVRAGDRTSTLDFRHHIWSPETFSQLIPASATKAAICDGSDVLKRLLTPTVSELTRLDQEISAQLEKDPQNPCLHESAALLLGSFEMREVWSQLVDPRPVLNRMAAHLAIARAGRGEREPSPGGTIADLMLLSLAWRHDGFPERLRLLAGTASELEKTWLRVISLYSVQDWRELPNPGKATLAERTAYLLALSNKTDSNRVLRFLDDFATEPIADWSRLAFVRARSVETCNRFGDTGPEVVLGETEEAYTRTLGRPLPPDQIVQALNEEQTDRRIGRVLGWPLWAAFEQRSLLTMLMQQESCVSHMLGMAQEGVQLRKTIDARFGSLRGYPLLLRHMAATSAEYNRAVAGSLKLTKERPDLVNWCSWVYTSSPTSLGPPPQDLPPEHEWFAPRLPYGTAFDYNMRQRERNGHSSDSLPMLEEVQKHVFHALCRRLYADAKYHHHAPVAVLKPLYGQIAEFDRDAMISIADAARESDPVEFKRAAGDMCKMSVDDCSFLAAYLKDHNEAEEAARLYQRWVDGARDRVAVSNSVEWLVNYYADHGQKEKALSTARMAAEVNSAQGLETMGRLEAKLGHPDEALEYFLHVHDRYDDPRALTEFLVARRQEPRFKAALEKTIASVFPKGQEPFQESGFGQVRPDGPYIERSAQEKYQIGLIRGDVVVGVDAVRVHSKKQLRVQRRLSTDEHVKVAYWRAGKVLQGEFSREALGNQEFADDQPE